jgi:hypothetical protein
MATARALLSSALLATLASAQLPPWPPSWRMNDSTIAMPCNFSGYTDPAAMAGWAITDYDVRGLKRRPRRCCRVARASRALRGTRLPASVPFCARRRSSPAFATK